MIKLMVLVFILVHVNVDNRRVTARTGAPVEIVPAKTATHIVRITTDSLILARGSTYRFTVDTPEDRGLVSTVPGSAQLFPQLAAKDGAIQQYQVMTKVGALKDTGVLETGDRLLVTSRDGKNTKIYQIGFRAMALSGQLRLDRGQVTVNARRNLIIYFTAGQRTPNATVRIYLPAGITINENNTTVNVIGRGDVKLKNLAAQSLGRVGSAYPIKKVGNFALSALEGGGSVLLFKHLDLRPANGYDLKIVISDVTINRAGEYPFRATYSTSSPEVLTSAGIGSETALLRATSTISDLERVPEKGPYSESATTYTSARFKWYSKIAHARLMQSTDEGKSWKMSAAQTDFKNNTAKVSALRPDKLYLFKLLVTTGQVKGSSNTVRFYSGKMDVKSFGAAGDGKQDDTEKINAAIDHLEQLGGGTVLFNAGVYNVRTIHLKSNVFLYVAKNATIKAIKGADAPEDTWFSDKRYRSGLSPTDTGPYAEPENWLTKQDVGHHYFRNAMFFGERLDNVKIIGNGRITGDGNLVNGDNVMKNSPDNRADKMFTLKLCTDVEIGGFRRAEDLWYDPAKDEPYYIGKNNAKLFDVENMLNIDRSGHFALLATGTDGVFVHDTYFGKNSTANVRDIYDFMQCSNVAVTNIYCKVSSDDIVKPGSDCSLGFTRPARNFRIRNIIGDTNCNVFQIGSETADDIMDVHVDNIYVLGANKAGFSISTNDGAHIKNIHLNCGHTGPIHSRSKMLRTATPFFISMSNRGRILGAEVGLYKFTSNGQEHHELLVKNVNIGQVENIILNGVDISEVYAGSSYNKPGARWKSFDGSQKRASPIVAGYALPDSASVIGGLDFKLPDGKHTGYIRNILFNDVHVLVKGGNPLSDIEQNPPELGVGQYNASNLKVQPSYGLWARHVQGLSVRSCTFNYENRDSRYALFLDDVLGARISGVKMARSRDMTGVIGLKNAAGVTIQGSGYYTGEWGRGMVLMPSVNQVFGKGIIALPDKPAGQ